jgi:hypothetical protein
MQLITPNEAREYEGFYLAHWEVARFCIDTGVKRFGLFAIRERWVLYFPESFELPWGPEFGGKPKDFRHSDGRLFTLRFSGVVEPKGAYGHLGFCHRSAKVEQVLQCKEVDLHAGRCW